MHQLVTILFNKKLSKADAINALEIRQNGGISTF